MNTPQKEMCGILELDPTAVIKMAHSQQFYVETQIQCEDMASGQLQEYRCYASTPNGAIHSLMETMIHNTASPHCYIRIRDVRLKWNMPAGCWNKWVKASAA